MTNVDRMLTEYKLVTRNGKPYAESVERWANALDAQDKAAGGPRPGKSYLVVPTMPVDVYEIDETRDDLPPAWIVLGVLLIAAEYFWLFSAAG